MVGASGFEPPASCSRSRRASQAALRPDNQPGKPNQTLAHRGNLQSSTRRGNGQEAEKRRPGSYLLPGPTAEVISSTD